MSKKRRQKSDKKPQQRTTAYKIYIPKGYLRFPDGQKVELYSIGVIADVLVRDWREIRDWEYRGLIPLSPFCDAFGRRLYTKDMIRVIVRCAEEYKVPIKGKGAHHPLKQQGFFIQLAVRLERLYRLYEARLEIKLPEEYQSHNLKFIRKYVVHSKAYANFQRKKELRKLENAKSAKKDAQNEEKLIGSDGEVTQNSEEEHTNTSNEERNISTASDNTTAQKSLDKEDGNTTMRMEYALSIVMRNFNLEDKGYVLTGFDDKGEGKKCTLTLSNGAFTITATIHDW